MATSSVNQAPASGLITNPKQQQQQQTISNSKDDASIASGSSGCGSLTKKKPIEYQPSLDVDPQSIVSSIITDSGISETSDTQLATIFDRLSNITQVHSNQNLNAQQQMNAAELGHSRNSSNTSQVSSNSHDKYFYGMNS